jgi:hypothetical protein
MVRLGKSVPSKRQQQKQQQSQSSSSTYYSSSSTIPDSILIPLLAQKSYHLPYNNWQQDWVQWMRNNHVVFGICFCYKLHPIEWWERIIVLLSSMSFALIAINIYYLWWELDEYVLPEENDIDPYQQLYSVTIFGKNFVITQATIVLWTVGGIIHSVWDFTIWQMAACACCHPGGRWYDSCGSCSRKCHDLGSYILIPIVLMVMSLAVYSSYLRTHHTLNDQDQEEALNNTDDLYNNVTGGTLGQFSFIVKYFVELILSWILYFPIFGTIMFSGILGCSGKIPILGGRPRDKAMVDKELADYYSHNSHRYSRF